MIQVYLLMVYALPLRLALLCLLKNVSAAGVSDNEMSATIVIVARDPAVGVTAEGYVFVSGGTPITEGPFSIRRLSSTVEHRGYIYLRGKGLRSHRYVVKRCFCERKFVCIKHTMCWLQKVSVSVSRGAKQA
jgi:hypothetical protein